MSTGGWREDSAFAPSTYEQIPRYARDEKSEATPEGVFDSKLETSKLKNRFRDLKLETRNLKLFPCSRARSELNTKKPDSGSRVR